MSKTTFRIKGWHAIAGFVAFFAVVFSVNAIFITLATRTFPGMSVQHPYQKGIDYNQTIEARKQAAEEGWEARFVIDNDQSVVVFINNADGPVDGLEVSVRLFWPGLPKEDKRLKLLPSGPGEYRVALDATLLPSRTMEFEGQAVRLDNRWVFPFVGRL